jgi:hypothetical protein
MAQGRKTGGRQKGTPKTGGRVAGVPNKANRLIHEAMIIPPSAYVEVGLTPAMIENLTPLGCMLLVMHKALEANNLPLAMSCAAVAAPCVHPRLTSSEVRVSGTIAHLSDQDLEQEIAALEARIRAAEAEPVH